MTKKLIFCLLTFLFSCSTCARAAHFDLLQYYLKSTFIMAPFYPHLDNNSRSQYLSIAQNTNLTQNQLGKEIEKWAKKQSPEIQKKLEKVGKKLIYFLVEFAQQIDQYKFSQEAQVYGKHIKDIISNNNMTIFESERKTSEVIDSAPPKIQQQLARFVFWTEKKFVNIVLSLGS
uniref:SXP/RAL-2 family protein Ani s 5-like cation-binding domain-containing protein n=1 Tax=Acrobeloides nanus TaxID=290746 RepID=A0A914DDZ6_9BILA